MIYQSNILVFAQNNSTKYMENAISERFKNIIQKIKPFPAQLIAVTKTKPIATLEIAYKLGYKIFGENKVQEMVEKYEALPKDIQWHLIGHLQSNKVKYMAHFVAMIHGVDNLDLLKEINKQAKKHNRIIPCLLQIFIATEETKFGLDFTQAEVILKIINNSPDFQNISIAGLMGMASYTNNKTQIDNEFKLLKNYFQILQTFNNGNNIHLVDISMGMSGDFEIALQNGSTMVRIGSSIFEER